MRWVSSARSRNIMWSLCRISGFIVHPPPFISWGLVVIMRYSSVFLGSDPQRAESWSRRTAAPRPRRSGSLGQLVRGNAQLLAKICRSPPAWLSIYTKSEFQRCSPPRGKKAGPFTFCVIPVGMPPPLSEPLPKSPPYRRRSVPL